VGVAAAAGSCAASAEVVDEVGSVTGNEEEDSGREEEAVKAVVSASGFVAVAAGDPPSLDASKRVRAELKSRD